jgi:hypothetical protein
MTEQKGSRPSVDLERIVESARRLGVELDEVEAMQWLTAISAAKSEGEVVVDTKSGVFGHKITLLDFSTEDLAYFRKIGDLVEIHDRPGVVETALALSGSAAQSKIQTYPGDCDYFERVNIKADTREEACRLLANVIRDKPLAKAEGPTYQLIEVKMGSYPFDVVKDGEPIKSGSPIAWSADEIENKAFQVFTPDGSAESIEWETAAQDPGWCKMDWVVADPVRGKLANASNMFDVTWEAPDGSITPLDGYLDPYFQEVYLEAESIPLFSKLVKHVSSDALENYVQQLEGEVRKYLKKDPNYGKAAKRMYNIFRLTGRYEEAAYVRELFDEPATALYQVWSLIRTIDDVAGYEDSISKETLLNQADALILSVVGAIEGDEEAEIVRHLLSLRDALGEDAQDEAWEIQVETCRAEVMNVVNNFFQDRLTNLPAIQAYMEQIHDD